MSDVVVRVMRNGSVKNLGDGIGETDGGIYYRPDTGQQSIEIFRVGSK